MYAPYLNATSVTLWEADRARAKESIIKWLAESSEISTKRLEVEGRAKNVFQMLIGQKTLAEIIFQNPGSLLFLRSVTRRNIGTSQIATFLEMTTSAYEAYEAGKKSLPLETANKIANLLATELDTSIVSWILSENIPSESEITRTVVISADRILQRATSTQLRYMHEPRQLGILKKFLESRGYTEVPGKGIVNPKTDLAQGTFAFRVNVDGTTVDGINLKQNVDTLVMPKTASSEVFPIFIEAKSMTDEVNPNKRQKEEAQKVDNLRRRWQTEDERINFILLLGGTVPKRYLEVEAGSGLDWIWEHRVEDLAELLDWYSSH